MATQGIGGPPNINFGWGSPIHKDDQEFIQGKTELLQFLLPMLIPLMGMRVMEFGMKTIFTGKTNVNENFGEQGHGLEIIKNQIDSVEEKELKELIALIKLLRTEWENKSLREKSALEKEAYKACFNAMGKERLANIMRSNLFGLVQENTSSPDVQAIIEAMADGFKDYCMKELEQTDSQ